VGIFPQRSPFLSGRFFRISAELLLFLDWLPAKLLTLLQQLQKRQCDQIGRNFSILGKNDPKPV
jgi:hypothetical protein